jgi:transposase, IS6 family
MRRDLAAARRFFTRRSAPARSRLRSPPAVHPYTRWSLMSWSPRRCTLEQYANNPVEADHGRLKARLRPVRGLKRHRSARILAFAI